MALLIVQRDHLLWERSLLRDVTEYLLVHSRSKLRSHRAHPLALNVLHTMLAPVGAQLIARIVVTDFCVTALASSEAFRRPLAEQ